MAVIAWLIVLFLGIQCSVGEIHTGCLKWEDAEGAQKGIDVCCEMCHPGNRLVKKCGRDPKYLCTPCEPGTYTVHHKDLSCHPCTQCVGAQVLLQACTATTDTKCGCREGLTCGDERCSFCVETCEKGFEPTADRDCRKCPNGTFNDKVHQKCKPWSTKCSNPNEQIEFKGDALNDIKCVSVKTERTHGKKDESSDAQDPIWPLFVIVGILVLFPITIIIMMIMAVKKLQKRKKTKKRIHEKIIVNPTDDPRTLIAIECSFHEAQQEQGSTCSSESLDSKDSSEQLIA